MARIIKMYDGVLDETTYCETWVDLREYMRTSFIPEQYKVIDELIEARKMNRWTGDIEAYLGIKITVC